MDSEMSLAFSQERSPLWSISQSSWLQIRRPGFDSRHYQGKKCSGSGTRSIQPREYNWGATRQKRSGSCLENREYGRRDPSRWPRGTLYPQKLSITSPTSGGRSVGIVRSRTQTMEVFLFHKIPSTFTRYSCYFHITVSVKYFSGFQRRISGFDPRAGDMRYLFASYCCGLGFLRVLQSPVLILIPLKA
jgi:ribosomal protein L37E